MEGIVVLRFTACHFLCRAAPAPSERDPDTHKGSVPTVVKEVGKQFNAKEGGRRVCQKDLGDAETRWA